MNDGNNNMNNAGREGQPPAPGDAGMGAAGAGMSEEQMMNMSANRQGMGPMGMGGPVGMGAGMPGNGMAPNQGMGGQGMGAPGMGMGTGMGGQGMGGPGMGGPGMGMGMAGMAGMNPFAMQAAQGEMGTGGMDGYLGQGGGFVPELDMMALLRAKQKLNMMNRGAGGVQEKFFGFQDQFGKGPMNRPEDFQVSSAMIDKLKRSSDDMNGEDPDADEPKGKKRKKAKKPNDMPRRALSAYNIFFSQQREIILREIETKEKVKKMKEEGKTDEEIEEFVKKDEEERKAAAEEKEKEAKAIEEEESKNDKKEDGEESKEGSEGKKEGEGSGLPSVMSRTFFPTRAKRAHRKVHGKIGLVSLAREVSTRWKALDPEERKHYQDLAEKDRERHKKVMADYQERKAAENMISMGSPAHESQEAPQVPPENGQRLSSEQDIRDSMAQQYQQRILAEMMAARQQQAAGQQMMGMGMMGAGMMGMGGAPQPASFLGMGGMMGGGQPGNLAGLQGGDPSLLGLNMNNPAQAQMWRQMGMGPL